jgi:hypothetical protein
MKQDLMVKIPVGIVVFALLIVLLVKVIVEPRIEKLIQAALIEKPGDYLITIEKVQVSILHSEVELENISLVSKSENEEQPGLSGEIESARFKGIHMLKVLFRKELDIRKIEIYNSRLRGEIPFEEKTRPAVVAPRTIRIKSLLFNKLFIDLKDAATTQTYLVSEGVLKMSDIRFQKKDTLSPGIIGQIDFDMSELKTVTSDSLYTFKAEGISYSSNSNILTANNFAIQPNYSEYAFAARNQFETDRFEGRFSQLSFHDFSAETLIKSGNLTTSLIEIGAIELNIFRDKRKEFRHIDKPTFQDFIYNYPGNLNIDSIRILSGNIVISQHAEEAAEKGSIWFSKIDATISKISNDTIYKTEKGYLELNANGLLMDKGRLTVLLKATIFDRNGTFTVSGALSGMEASALNPMLEKTAFITINSGIINDLNFSFSADNTKATGTLIVLYQGLNVAVINKKTGESSGIMAWVKSVVANIIMIESNPMPGEDVRPGVIEYERDPERFLFNYIVKALLSGINTSITKKKVP